MTVNADLFRRTFAHIEAHPDQLDMSWWRCGTARCFGGWASSLAGGHFISSQHNTERITIDGEMYFRSSVIRTAAGELMSVEQHAMRELGIDEQTVDVLFNEDNTIADLRRMVSNLIDYGVAHDPTVGVR